MPSSFNAFSGFNCANRALIMNHNLVVSFDDFLLPFSVAETLFIAGGYGPNDFVSTVETVDVTGTYKIETVQKLLP